METDNKRRLVVFIALQLLLPAALLGLRFVDQGWWPTRELPMSWQMYSSGSDKTCDETDLC